jgi:16S rRNA (cytosine967-C5)-methyltransferase
LSLQNNNARAEALSAICSVVLEKKSLSNFEFSSPHAQSLAFGTIRWYHHLNQEISNRLKSDFDKEDLDIFCLLTLGAYQILYTETPIHAAIFETVELCKSLNSTWATGLVNAILRNIERNKVQINARTYPAHPSWLIKKIKQYYPNDFENIFIQNNTQAPMTLRLHPDFNQQKFNIESHSLTELPQARVLQKPTSVCDLPDFDNGSCFVQDASAQLAAHLLAPKNTDLVLDACCAPGGKTTHLCELAPNAKIIALDNSEQRLERVTQNLTRLNITTVDLCCGNAKNQDWWDGVLFDKILLDAPCSATGVIRRHPDIKLLRKPKDISNLVLLQQQILENLWQMLKPDGVLLYATCSILKPENDWQITNFLQHHTDAIEEKITLNWGTEMSAGRQQIPSYDFDGFYYAKLRKLN